jgi:hypothetical protein
MGCLKLKLQTPILLMVMMSWNRKVVSQFQRMP